MRIYLGNDTAAQEHAPDADGMRVTTYDRSAVTVVDTPDDNPLLTLLSEVRDLVGYHMSGEVPWVACENDMVAQALAQQFGTKVKDFAEAEAAYHAAAGHAPEVTEAAIMAATTTEEPVQ